MIELLDITKYVTEFIVISAVIILITTDFILISLEVIEESNNVANENIKNNSIIHIERQINDYRYRNKKLNGERFCNNLAK